MSIYERRFNYSAGGVSHYTDDPVVVANAIREHGIEYVADGYAESEDVPEGYGRIGGTLFTRRTNKVYTADEFIAEFCTAEH